MAMKSTEKKAAAKKPEAEPAASAPAAKKAAAPAKAKKAAAPKAAAVKAVAPAEGKTPPGKKIAKPASGKPNALQQPLQPSAELAAIVGEKPLARGEVVSKVWEYIKANKLQNPKDGREILADGTLKKVFGKDKVTMFEMNKHLAQHLK